MDFNDLKLVCDIGDAGSFAEAARRADLDPSAVSRAVSRIETELGARLFHRSTRHLTPTEAGGRFLARAEMLVADFDEARACLNAHEQVPRGTLRLTASVGFAQQCIVPHIPHLRDLYPEMGIELLATDANLDLTADGVDLAVRLAPAPKGDYVVSKLLEVTYRVVASPEYAARAGLQNPEDLEAVSCLCFALPAFRSRWLFRGSDGVVTQVPVSGAVSALNSLALKSLAVAGTGPALLPHWLVAREIEKGQLVTLFDDHEVTATSFDSAAWLLYPSRRLVPPKTLAVAQFLRDLVRDGALF